MLSKDYDEGDMGCTGIYRLRSVGGLGFERRKAGEAIGSEKFRIWGNRS